MYEVEEDQKVKLASLEFEVEGDQWWHQIVMRIGIGLNKRPSVVSWHDIKLCMHARFVPPHYRKELLLNLQQHHQRFRSNLTKINMHESEE